MRRLSPYKELHMIDILFIWHHILLDIVYYYLIYIDGKEKPDNYRAKCDHDN